MLCKINATLGGSTDERARAINFLRALQAICTAPAGSTPSVPSVGTGPTASPSGTNVITEVISNTEAGGWTTSSSTNITSNYSNSFASPYQLDLYRDSGKAFYPFRKLSFRTTPSQTFAGTYTTYPRIYCSYGFNTVSDASGNYTLGTTMAAFTNGANRFIQHANFDNAGANDMIYNRALAPVAGEYLIASTERYFIAISGSVGGNSGSLMYVGLRTTNAWEDQYDDNIPWVSLTYDGTDQYQQASPSLGYKAFMRTMQTTGTVNSNPFWYGGENGSWNNFGAPSAVTSNGFNQDALSGWANTNNGWNSYMQNESYYFAHNLQIPILPFGGMRSKFRNNVGYVGAVTDPATGTLVPPAYPLNVARNVQNSHNSGGTMIGIYKSLSGTDIFMQQYYTPGQTFVINNEAYYPYALGNDTNYRDLFLIRKY